jgi:ribose transport system ATP-binding protein
VETPVTIQPGDIVGISGVTGSGREELNACIFGAQARDGGTVAVNGREVQAHQPGQAIRSGMAFLPAERRTHGGLMSLSATENLTITALKDFWSAPSLRSRSEDREAERWFERLSVHPPGAWRSPLTSFSGGNQQKILLGKWLRLEPAVLLLDEPTQGVDAAATAEIYRQLLGAAEAGAALIVSTSDIDELVALCNRVLVIEAGTLVKELTGAEVNVGSVTSCSLGGTRRKAVQV